MGKNGVRPGWEGFMKKSFLHIDRQKFTGIVSILVFLVSGVLLLARPTLFTDLSVWFLMVILAGLAVYWGVRYFRSTPEQGAMGYDLAEALLALSLSLVLFFRRDLFDAALPMLWGALLVVGGFLLLQTAVDFLRMKVSLWWPQLAGAIVALALGALALVRPAFLTERMPLFIGISLIVVAAFNLMNLILMALHTRGRLNAKEKKPNPPAPAPAAAAEKPAPAADAAKPAPDEPPAAPAQPEKPAAPEKPAPATIFEELQQFAEQDKKQ